ncbi:MAG: hypothetical protein HUK02_06505 [Bacteroidaceae bacterium]|nr:hypothetical protein [Bacteroidaceae bacterium]
MYFESSKFEYLLLPNQKCVRFGNRVETNSFSQRCTEPNPRKRKVLGLGDSVIFGGSYTDQDSIATSIFNDNDSVFQILNISAGSWGPDNCAGYLEEYGLFSAEAMLLVCNSHDAHDNIDLTQKVVGTHVSYPNKQYSCAIVELCDRYVIPRVRRWFEKPVSLSPDEQVLQGIHKNGEGFNSGFANLCRMAQSNKIPFAIILHADRQEYQQGRYDSQGDEIMEWAKTNNVPLYKDIECGITANCYFDGIHLNNNGNKVYATIFQKVIGDLLP